MNGQNIVNLIRCRRGTHPLFRAFGLGDEVDGLNKITRGLIQVEVNRWFPSTYVESVESTANINGEFEYNVKVRGA